MKKITFIAAIILLTANLSMSQNDLRAVKKSGEITLVQTKQKTPHWQAYLSALIKKHKGDKVAIKKEIESLQINFVTKKIVVRLADGRVGGVYIDELLKAFTTVDQKILKMGLEDLMEMDGIKKNETLLACMGGGGMAGGQHITDMIGVDLSGGTASLTGITSSSGGITNLQGSNTNNLYAAFNNSQVTIANKGCMNAQIAGITGGLGMTPPSNPGYRNAVNSAVSKMENGLNNCDEGINPIAQENNQTGTTPVQNSSPTQAEIEGMIDIGLTLAETAIESGANPSPAGAVTAGIEILLTEAQVANPDNETLDILGLAVDGISTTVSGTTVIMAESLTLGSGVAVAAVGFGFYKLTKETGIGERSANALSNTYANHADKQWQKKYGNNSNKNSNPPGEGGAKTCEDAKRGWEKFKGYCEANGWQTYECMSFVAHMNKCADPSLVNPGPEGSYSCSGSNDANIVDACRQQCEAKKKIAKPGTTGGEMDCGCDGLTTRLQFNKALSKKICENSYDPNGATPCDQITPGIIGGNNPNPVTPMKTGDSKITPSVVTPSKTGPSIKNEGINPSKKTPAPVKNNL